MPLSFAHLQTNLRLTIFFNNFSNSFFTLQLEFKLLPKHLSQFTVRLPGVNTLHQNSSGVKKKLAYLLRTTIVVHQMIDISASHLIVTTYSYAPQRKADASLEGLFRKKKTRRRFMSDFTVTDLAVTKLKEYMQANNIDSALRIALMQGG